MMHPSYKNQRKLQSIFVAIREPFHSQDMWLLDTCLLVWESRKFVLFFIETTYRTCQDSWISSFFPRAINFQTFRYHLSVLGVKD